MAKYRKKPVEVYAVQWWGPANPDHPAVTISVDGREGWINTLEGVLHLSPGDWIVTGHSKGESWPVKPDIFIETYEKVLEQEPTTWMDWFGARW